MGQEATARTGAILTGRRGFDLGNRPGAAARARAIYDGAWTGPIFVLTHRAAENVEGATFLSGDIASAIARARAAADERDVGIFGADIARRCFNSGLVDEIIVHLVPVLLGDGVRLFDSHGAAPIELKKIRSDDPGQITDLSYALVR